MADNSRLTGRQEKALVALLSAPSIRDAAKVAGVGERTLYAWLKDPTFIDAYRQARREAVTQATGRLQTASSEAVTTLEAIMKDTEAPAPARVSAAKTVLELAVKTVEGDVDELMARVKALEASHSEKGPQR